MKTIQTKYIGSSNVRGARIKAFDCDGNSVTIPYPHELSGEDVHRKAAEALRDKMQWDGELIGGSIKSGYVFVFVNGGESAIMSGKLPKMPPVRKRQPFMQNLEGYEESLDSWYQNNAEAVEWFLENAEAIRKLLQAEMEE